MSILFGTETPVYESDMVMTSTEEYDVEPTEEAFAEILAESTIDISNMLSALYVADSMAEAMVIDEVITTESAVAVLEGSLKGTFDSVIGAIKKAWEKIKKWFKELGDKVTNALDFDAKFVKKYENEIYEKLKTVDPNKQAYKGYKYDMEAFTPNSIHGKANATIKKLLKNACTLDAFKITQPKTWKNIKNAGKDPGVTKDSEKWADALGTFKDTDSDFSSNLSEAIWGSMVIKGVRYENIGQLQAAIVREFRGGVDKPAVVNYGYLNKDVVGKMMAIVTNKNALKKGLNEAQKELEGEYKEVIAAIKKAKNMVGKEDGGVARQSKQVISGINTSLSILSNLTKTQVMCFVEYAKTSAKVLRALVKGKGEPKKSKKDDSVGEAYSDFDDILEEGATWKSIKAFFSDTGKKASKHLRAGRRALNAGEKSAAKNELTEAKKLLIKYKKQVNDIEDSIGGNICGWLLSTGVLQIFCNGFGFPGSVGDFDTAKLAIADITKYIGLKAIHLPLKVTSLANLLYGAVKLCYTHSTNIGKDDKSTTWNAYKADLINAIDSAIDLTDELLKLCGGKSSAKESVSAESLMESVMNMF